ncbi:MAG TPA: metal-sulfur cluster assembly factor [Herpetosiphonaceae bacterium]
MGAEDPGLDPELLEALKDVADPEFPLNIVDMGLVYAAWRDGETARVRMTFTAMGCPCMDFMIRDVEQRLRELPGVSAAKVEVVWSPPWTKARLTEEGRDSLMIWGVGV